MLSKISDSDSKDEDGYGSVVLSRKPKSKKRLSARKPPPIEDSDSSDFEEESKSTKYACEDGDTYVILIDDSEDTQDMEPEKVKAMQSLKTKFKLSEPTTTSASKKPSKEEEKKKKTEKRADKEKKTHRASQQQIGTANSSGCPLAKEIARLGELDRQQPPPSSSNKVVIFSVKLQ